MIDDQHIAKAITMYANDPIKGLSEPCELCESKQSEMDFILAIPGGIFPGGTFRAYLCFDCFSRDWPDDWVILEAVLAKRLDILAAHEAIEPHSAGKTIPWERAKKEM